MHILLSFEDYINENFGAITMEFPPGHDRPLIQTPDIIKPLSISGAYGGNARIPRQWKDAPYLSGGFSGSGYGHFGADTSDGDASSDLKDDSYKKHLKKDYKSLDDAKETITELNKEKNNRRDRIEKLKSLGKIDALWAKETNKKRKLDMYERELEGHSLEYYIEMTTAPTPGHPGSYMDPPEPGDPGEYEIKLDASDSNKRILKTLGFSDDDIRKIFSLDLQWVFNHAERWSTVPDIKQLASAALGKSEEIGEEIDNEYFDSELTNYSGDMFEDFEMDNALAYLAFKYIILIGIEKTIEKVQLEKEIANINRYIQSIPMKYKREMHEKQRDIKKAIQTHLEINFLGLMP